MAYAGYPSVAVPQQNVARPVRYPTMKVTVIRIFSVASIIFGLASIGIQVSIKKKKKYSMACRSNFFPHIISIWKNILITKITTLVLNVTEIHYYIIFEVADHVSAGIWGGIFYVIAGSFGLASSQQRTKSL